MGAYRERLLVPLSYWLLAVPVVVLLGAEAYFFVDGFIPLLVIGLLAVFVGTFLVHWSLATIEVTGSVLRADRDTLALSEAGDVIALDEKQARQLRGPRADPSALILLRPYLRRAVYIAVADPGEGAAPYWLIATRHPERLAAAIEQARSAGHNGAEESSAGHNGANGSGTGESSPGESSPGESSAGENRAGTDSRQPGGRQSVG
jgi:hypothetical protein